MRSRPPAPAHITPELFAQFRSPCRGNGNPEIMTNPVWVWMIEQKHSAYSANRTFDGPPSEDAGPCWSFDRFGRTETLLPDGRLVRIGGEHEDGYDADFYIYNDVFVTGAEGRTEILGYSAEVFPPTDFHTADLVGDRIVLIGNLSYPEFRESKVQVMMLDTARFGFERIDTIGTAPGWLHKHTSELAEDGRAIIVRGGFIADPRWPISIENVDDWRLDLETLRWDRLTRRDWSCYVFVRADGKKNHLFQLRHLARAQSGGKPYRRADDRDKALSGPGPQPRSDLLEALYIPEVGHSTIPAVEHRHKTHRINVDGATVSYRETRWAISLSIAGRLPERTVDRLRLDLLRKLAAIENADIDCMPVTRD